MASKSKDNDLVIGRLRIPVWGQLMLVCLAVVLVYLNTIDNGFVWDDLTYIYEWTPLHDLSRGLEGLLRDRQPDGITNFRPVKNVIFGLSYAAFGDNAALYHLEAMVLHVVISWLVYGMARELFDDPKMAVIAGLVFGVHPINTEAISWVTASMDSFGNLFFGLSFYLYLVYERKKKMFWLWGSVLVAFLAFLTNELSFSLVVIIGLYQLFWKQIKPKEWLATAKRHWPFVAGFLVYAGLRYWASDHAIEMKWIFDSPLATGVVMIRALFVYLRLLVWPVDLTVDRVLVNNVDSFYYFDFDSRAGFSGGMPSLFDEEVLVAVAWLAALGYGLWRLGRENKKWWFLAGFVLVSFLPVMQLVPTTTIFAERYAYIAAMGFALVLAYGYNELSRLIGDDKVARKYQKGLVFGLVGLLLFYGGLTILRNDEWRDQTSLWQSAVEHHPNSVVSLNNLGKAYYENGQEEEGLEYIEKAVALNPRYVIGLANLGYLYGESGKYLEAKKVLEQALELKPGDADSLFNLAGIYMEQGEYEQARQVLSEVLEKDPANVTTRVRLAKSFHEQFIFNMAELEYKRALEYAPRNTDALNNLGNLYLDMGRESEARELFGQVLEINPEHPFAQEKLEKLGQ